jgi:hypothetical protein
MSQRGEEQVGQLRDKAVCPACEYSLRGLAGDVVTCPECGRGVDVARLLSHQWTGKWHNVPGYTDLIMPVMWLLSGSLASALIWSWGEEVLRSPTAGIAATAATIGVWAFSIWRKRRLLDDGSALLMIGLAHGISAGYVGGAIAFVWIIINGVNLWPSPVCLVHLLLLGMVAAFLVFGRRGERFIAAQCLKQYLRDNARADTMPP